MPKKDKGPSRRCRLKQKVRESIKDRDTLVRQHRPFTYVEVIAVVDDETYVGMGFAKVKRPDVWDEEYGKQMALEKAVGHIAFQIVHGYDIHYSNRMEEGVSMEVPQVLEDWVKSRN